jgi:hypothetical protein
MLVLCWGHAVPMLGHPWASRHHLEAPLLLDAETRQVEGMAAMFGKLGT